MNKFSVRYFLAALQILLVVQAFAQRPAKGITIADSGFIFTNAPFKACHAATLVALPNQQLLASWFAGTHEGNADVCIWTASFNNQQWSPPVKVADGFVNDSTRYPCWNPVLFRNSDGMLFLFYKIGPNPREWWGMRKTSANNGLSWSPAEKLPNGMLGPIKNSSLQLANGSILHPSSTESPNEKVWQIHIEKSDRYANQWTKIPIDCDSFGVIQPSILQHKNGRLQLLCRSRQNAIVSTWSTDGGNTWSALKKLHLPNPNSGSDAITLKNGTHLLVYNPLLAGKDWWEGRSVLRVAKSKNGIDWHDVLTLEQQTKGEYSYPCIIEDEQGNVHIAYTFERRLIKYVRLKIE